VRIEIIVAACSSSAYINYESNPLVTSNDKKLIE